MNVAKRIKKMREAQDLTIEQVAEITGMTAQYLRAVETGEEVPSIGAVLKLSRALGARMGQLLHTGGNTRTDIFSICPAGKAQETERSVGDKKHQGYSYQSLLSSDIRGQGMEPFLVTFDPDATSTVEPTEHEGEEFIYVLSGKIELFYDGCTYTLGVGDSLYLDSSRAHSLKAVGSTPPKVIAVVYQRT